MEEKISIIVPVYKVEKYLDRCIDSIVRQTYTKLEIILVDDGSPDGCGAICDARALADPRIRVIHKPNGGLSDARNAGLAIATGAYIGFVDSDDFIHPAMYRDLYDRLRKYDADIAQCSYRVTTGDEMSEPGAGVDETVIDGAEALYRLYTPFKVDYVVAWDKLYRRGLFDSVRFPVSKIHEDEATTYKLFSGAKKMVVTGLKFYYYFQSPDSIIRSGFSEKKLHYADAMEERISFFRDRGMDQLCSLAIFQYAQWLLQFSYRNTGAMKEVPGATEGLRRRYARVTELAKGDPGMTRRQKTLLRLGPAFQPLTGFLVYQKQYKNNFLGRLAGVLGFD